MTTQPTFPPELEQLFRTLGPEELIQMGDQIVVECRRGLRTTREMASVPLDRLGTPCLPNTPVFRRK